MENKDAQYIKLTETPVEKLILGLSVPTIINMMVTNIYNLVDTAFVGTLGNSASGAVGVVFGFMAILQAFGFMFGQGSGSIASRYLGAKQHDKASEVASVAFFSALFWGLAVAILSWIFIDPLVLTLGSTSTIAPYAKTYISFILLAAPGMVASFTMNNILRYEGKAALGMIGLMTGGILNIGGDALFMFGMKMGIAGAGLSTCLTQWISFFILLWMFLSGKTVCKLSIFRVPGGVHEIPNIVGTGLPSLLRQGLNSITTVLLNTHAAVYGDEAVAAFSIVSRISFFVFSVALGVGQGYQPVSSFNYGAGKYDRIRKGYRFTVLLAQAMVTVLGVIVMIFDRQIIYLFRDDTTVIDIAQRALNLQLLSQLLLPICMVTEMQLQSTGKKLGASILSCARSGLFFIPTLIIMAHIRGLAGIQEAQPIATLLGVIPTYFFATKFFRELPRENK